MTDAGPIQLATLIVTGGAVAFALSAGVWAYRMTAGARAARADWRARMAQLEDRLERAGRRPGRPSRPHPRLGNPA